MKVNIADYNMKQEIIEYISDVQHDFQPPFLERIITKSKLNSIKEYVEKVLEHGKVLFIKLDNEIAGVLLVYLNDRINHESYIPFLSVKEKFSGRGLASKLLSTAEQLAIDNNMKQIMVKTWKANHSAIRLYEKHNFTTQELGEDILFIKNIS